MQTATDDWFWMCLCIVLFVLYWIQSLVELHHHVVISNSIASACIGSPFVHVSYSPFENNFVDWKHTTTYITTMKSINQLVYSIASLFAIVSACAALPINVASIGESLIESNYFIVICHTMSFVSWCNICKCSTIDFVCNTGCECYRTTRNRDSHRIAWKPRANNRWNRNHVLHIENCDHFKCLLIKDHFTTLLDLDKNKLIPNLSKVCLRALYNILQPHYKQNRIHWFLCWICLRNTNAIKQHRQQFT